jgi:hypothetical protein
MGSIINSSALMIQLIHESLFILSQTIIKADTVIVTDALDASWASDPFYANALTKLGIADADDAPFTATTVTDEL